MFVLADCIASLGHLVALFLLYKETESVILIDTKSFSQSSECSFSLSLSACLHVSACFPPLMNFLRACILDFNMVSERTRSENHSSLVFSDSS